MGIASVVPRCTLVALAPDAATPLITACPEPDLGASRPELAGVDLKATKAGRNGSGLQGVAKSMAANSAGRAFCGSGNRRADEISLASFAPGRHFDDTERSESLEELMIAERYAHGTRLPG